MQVVDDKKNDGRVQRMYLPCAQSWRYLANLLHMNSMVIGTRGRHMNIKYCLSCMEIVFCRVEYSYFSCRCIVCVENIMNTDRPTNLMRDGITSDQVRK